MQDNLNISFEGGTLFARPLCEIDHHSAVGLRESIDDALFRYKPEILVLDFSKVGFMDSSGLGLILGRAETARALRASVRITGLNQHLLKLVRISGIERLSNITVDGACSDFSNK